MAPVIQVQTSGYLLVGEDWVMEREVWVGGARGGEGYSVHSRVVAGGLVREVRVFWLDREGLWQPVHMRP